MRALGAGGSLWACWSLCAGCALRAGGALRAGCALRALGADSDTINPVFGRRTNKINVNAIVINDSHNVLA